MLGTPLTNKAVVQVAASLARPRAAAPCVRARRLEPSVLPAPLEPSALTAPLSRAAERLGGWQSGLRLATLGIRGLLIVRSVIVRCFDLPELLRYVCDECDPLFASYTLTWIKRSRKVCRAPRSATLCLPASQPDASKAPAGIVPVSHGEW